MRRVFKALKFASLASLLTPSRYSIVWRMVRQHGRNTDAGTVTHASASSSSSVSGYDDKVSIYHGLQPQRTVANLTSTSTDAALNTANNNTTYSYNTDKHTTINEVDVDARGTVVSTPSVTVGYVREGTGVTETGAEAAALNLVQRVKNGRCHPKPCDRQGMRDVDACGDGVDDDVDRAWAELSNIQFGRNSDIPRMNGVKCSGGNDSDVSSSEESSMEVLQDLAPRRKRTRRDEEEIVQLNAKVNENHRGIEWYSSYCVAVEEYLRNAPLENRIVGVSNTDDSQLEREIVHEELKRADIELKRKRRQ
jgi:hypothetical protein